MTEVSLEQMTAARRDHLAAGREIHLQDMRGYRFCEIGLITGPSQDDALTNVWNTTGTCDPTPEQLDTLDAAAIARENEALGAWLEVRQWMFDRLDVWEAGDSRTFGDISGTWMGVTGMPRAAAAGSYRPGYVYRNRTATFSAGSEVYLLEAPDGEAFIMQSLAPGEDPARSGNSPAHLGGRLDLPAGWGFRAEVLDEDLAVSSAGPDHRAHVLHDDLHNVYQGSDVGRAFTKFCRQGSEW
jgi:hypothetical protein